MANISPPKLINRSSQLKTRVQNALEIISTLVVSNPIEKLGLFDGFAGQSLFITYLDVFENTDYDRTAEYFNLLQQKLATQEPIGPHISDGIAGIIWYFQHLHNIELLDDASAYESLLKSTVDVAFIEMNKGSVEFLYGAMGLAISLFDTSVEKEIIPRFINELSNTASKNEVGHHWISDVEEGSTKLTVSHGSLSILYFLLKAFDKGIEKEKCKTLINGFVSFILSREFEKPDMSLFPYEVGENIKEKDSKRMAWCYGDLMIGYLLLWTGKSLQNESYTKDAIRIIDYLSTRRDLKKTACNDPMFCHGAIGVSQAFHRIYQYTGSELHKETQEYWLGVTLDYLEKSDFKDIFFDFGTNTHTENHGYLEGTAGIGLGLITYLNPELDAWDSSVMLS